MAMDEDWTELKVFGDALFNPIVDYITIKGQRYDTRLIKVNGCLIRPMDLGSSD